MRNDLPYWFRQAIPSAAALEKAQLLSEFNINTVCKEAKCPNFSSCFGNSSLTFMILGDTCTRSCRFCAVKKSEQKKLDLDLDEPWRIKEAVSKLGLRYVVITSVTRDDLADAGSGIFAEAIKLIRLVNPQIKVEALIPDFSGSKKNLEAVVAAGPSVLGHNLETVRRLYPSLKPEADYSVSLAVLSTAKELAPALITKSSLILGLGEREEEVKEAMRDLRKVDCDILTLGQYLVPSPAHCPVEKFIDPAEFQRYRKIGLGLGFKAVLSAPLARSSFMAEEVYEEALHV